MLVMRFVLMEITYFYRQKVTFLSVQYSLSASKYIALVKFISTLNLQHLWTT